MKFVILGAGRVGYGIAKALSLNENDVSIIDKSASCINTINEKLDVKPLLGDATDIELLKEAGIERADYLIAVTSSDETNLIACEIANLVFKVPFKIARISKKSYFYNKEFLTNEKFAIDLVIFPEMEIAEVVKKSLSIPGTLSVSSVFYDNLRLIGVTCKKKSPLSNIQLKNIYNIIEDFEIAITCIQRNNKIIIPTKTDYIIPEDNIYFIVSKENTSKAMSFFGIKENEHNNLVIIGGGNMEQDIISPLVDNDFDINIKIIENDIKKAELLSENLTKVDVLHGNPLEKDTLDIANVREAGLVISMTNDDKINILSCLIAKKYGAKRVSAILNDSSYSELIYSLGINTILDSRQMVVSKILQFIRKGGLESILGFDDGTEILSIDVFDNSHAVGTLTDDMTIRGEILIIAIYRNESFIILPRKLLINAGDKILFIAKKAAIERIMKLFQEKPKYLS